MAAALRWTGLVAAVLAFILVPFALFGDAMDAWAMSVLSGRAPPEAFTAAVIAGLLAADIVLPTPSSFVSTAAGALLGFVPGAVVSWAGMTLGCGLGYWVGAGGGRAAESVVDEADVRRVGAVLEGHGVWALAMMRAVPVLAEASVLMAGMGRMDRRIFLAVVLPANAGISLAYAWVGAYAAEARSFLLAFAGAMLLPLLAIGAMRLLGRRDSG